MIKFLGHDSTQIFGVVSSLSLWVGWFCLSYPWSFFRFTNSGVSKSSSWVTVSTRFWIKQVVKLISTNRAIFTLWNGIEECDRYFWLVSCTEHHHAFKWLFSSVNRVICKVKQMRSWVVSQTLSLRESTQSHPSFPLMLKFIIHKEWCRAIKNQFFSLS